MREIKFRVWNKKEEKMYWFTKLWICSEYNSLAFRDERFGDESYDDVPYYGEREVMQFTGLCDKNGKAIYEEDRITFQAGYYKAKRNQTVTDTVIFEAACFKTKKYKMPISAIPNCEVIGNIYENKENLRRDSGLLNTLSEHGGGINV